MNSTILINQVNDKYEVSFSYNPEVIQLVKAVPGREWNPVKKRWYIPKNNLGMLLAQLKGTRYENNTVIRSDEDINVDATLDPTSVIPEEDISEVKEYVKPGYTLYKHQRDLLKFAIHRKKQGFKSGFILCDEQGLGKTLSIINLSLHLRKTEGMKHCLVICCINGGKYNWAEDIREHTRGKESGYILGSRIKKRKQEINFNGSGLQKLEDLQKKGMYGDGRKKFPFFIIMNIEAVRYQEKKRYPIAEELVKLINEGEIGMVVIDEIHKNCSPSSKQGKKILDIKKATGNNAEFIPMTGTPITKKPTDLYTPLKLIDAHSYSSYYLWCQNYCIYGGFGGHEIIGYKNIPVLKQMLQNNMLRRLKKDVLDLPPKVRTVEYVDNTPTQRTLYSLEEEGLRREKNTIIKSNLNPLSKFMRLRQVNGSPELIDKSIDNEAKDYLSKNAKMKRLLEYVDDLVNYNGEKVIIYSNWVEPLRTIYKQLTMRKYKVLCFTGTMKNDVREQHKQKFLKDPEYKILLGTIEALGTAHTLTSCTNVIFYDEPWNPSDKVQAEDRVHRIGAKGTVNIVTLICKGTVDERVHNILYTKEGISSYIVDNELDIHSNPELFDLLLGGKQEGVNLKL